jgi:hypothetical protein
MTTPTEDPQKKELTPEEEEQSMATMTRGRVAARLEERRKGKIEEIKRLLGEINVSSDALDEEIRKREIEEAKKLFDEINAYSDALRAIEDVSRNVRKSEAATLAKELGKSKEQTELLANLELQYPKMVKTLKRYEIPLKGMPSWESIKNGLTREVLRKVLNLQQPTLLLVPPTARKEKVKALDTHKVSPQRYNTTVYELEDDDLWNGGKRKPKKKQWEVIIVEGIQDVEAPTSTGTITSFEMVKAWVKKLEKQGLDVMTGADAYLILQMKGLQEGKLIDSHTYTVLNGKNIDKCAMVSLGYFYDGQVYLYYSTDSYGIRLRGSVGVDVQKS